jgi:hypothetical protein
MSDEHRTMNQIEIDFDKIVRVGQKINDLLVKRTKGSPEAYAVLRFLCIYYEQDLGIQFQPEFEEALKDLVKKSMECREEPSSST